MKVSTNHYTYRIIAQATKLLCVQRTVFLSKQLLILLPRMIVFSSLGFAVEINCTIICGFIIAILLFLLHEPLSSHDIC